MLPAPVQGWRDALGTDHVRLSRSGRCLVDALLHSALKAGVHSLRVADWPSLGFFSVMGEEAKTSCCPFQLGHLKKSVTIF